MSNYREISLSDEQVYQYAEIGLLRDSEANRLGCRGKHGIRKGRWTNDEVHVIGACGEAAVALLLFPDRPVSLTVNTFKAPDLTMPENPKLYDPRDGGIQVRTRFNHDYDLIVRPNDSRDDLFILVTTEDLNTCRVHGYLYGRDATKREYLRGYGNREPAYFVPQSDLHSINKLICHLQPDDWCAEHCTGNHCAR